MFYTMKPIVLLVAASLMLIGATIAVALPNTVHANPNFEWCYTSASIHCGFDNKGQCIKDIKESGIIVVEPCHKVPKA